MTNPVIHASTIQNNSITIDVLSDQENLSISSVTSPENGSVQIITTSDGKQKIIYIPNSDYFGIDNFEYITTDNSGTAITHNLKVYISSLENTSPVIASNAPNEIILEEDISKTVAIATYLSDIDGDLVTIDFATDPSHGQLTITEDQNIIYRPNTNYHGLDSFTYYVSDGNGGYDVKTVNLNIRSINDIPYTTTNFFLQEDGFEKIIDILSFARDDDGDEISISHISQPLYGSVTLITDASGNQKISYSPDQNHIGYDSFYYILSDGTSTSLNQMVIGDSNIVDSIRLEELPIIPGQDFSFDLSKFFSDLNGETLSYSFLIEREELPAWVSFDDASNILSGSVPIDLSADLQLNITINNQSQSSSRDITLKVTNNALLNSDGDEGQNTIVSYQDSTANQISGLTDDDTIINFSDAIIDGDGGPDSYENGGNDTIINYGNGDVNGDGGSYTNGGNDTITNYGLGTINGGSGNDNITNYGSGDINGNADNDTITNYGDGTIDGGNGVNTITNYGDGDIYSGSDKDTIISYGDSNIIDSGGNDNDITNYGSGNIETGDENDIINNYGNGDILAGDGDDIITNRGLGNIETDGGINTIINYGDGDIISYGSDKDVITSYGNSNIEVSGGNNEITNHGDGDIISSDGNDTIINHGNGNIEDDGGENTIINYGNGSIITGDDIDTITNYGNGDIDTGSKSDTINSFGNSTINPGTGDDFIYSSSLNGRYEYNQGGGHDIIEQYILGQARVNGVDRIIFDSAVNYKEVYFEKNGNNLIIKFQNNPDDSITIIDQFNSIANPIEYLEFSTFSVVKLPDFQNEDLFDLSQNQNPISDSINLTTQKNRPTTIDVLAGASDADNDNLEILSFSQGNHGLVEVLTYQDGQQKLIYTPNQNYQGSDRIEYVISDMRGGFITKELVIEIVAPEDTFRVPSTISNLSAKIGKESVFDLSANITNPDDHELTITITDEYGNDIQPWIEFDPNNLNLTVNPLSRDYGLKNFIINIFNKTMQSNHQINFSLIIDENLTANSNSNIITANANNDYIEGISMSSDLIIADERDNNINLISDGSWNIDSYSAWNPYTQDIVRVYNTNRSFDAFDGGDGYDVINLTTGNDALALHDPYSDNASSNQVRLANIEEINGSLGDDIIDISSSTLTYTDITLNGNDGNDTLWSNDGNDTINGGTGDDHIVGGRGDDTLNGGDDNDTIKGYDGNDIINGGLGQDILNGGIGNDSFIFNSLEDSAINFSDVIEDFTKGEDIINLSGISELTSFDSLEITIENGHTIIKDRNSDFAIDIAQEIVLTSDDFIF